MATAYCMKCRKKVDIKDAKQITLKNGRPAMQGSCPTCGTKVFRIGKASPDTHLISDEGVACACGSFFFCPACTCERSLVFLGVFGFGGHRLQVY